MMARSFRFGGSSPLARGLPPNLRRPSRLARIIPARAGFTAPARTPACRQADHPRSRGVYEWGVPRPRAVAGSSPLARGLRTCQRNPRATPGIIPARAGFTFEGVYLEIAGADHPRSRGVYLRYGESTTVHPGSSPLARGLPVRFSTRRRSDGIIPSRGVYRPRRAWRALRAGSSPLARGLRARRRSPMLNVRIIPARAGFTARPRRGLDV